MANILNVCLFIYDNNQRTVKKDETAEETIPTHRRTISFDVNSGDVLYRSNIEAENIVGTASKNEYSTACCRVKPTRIPLNIVAADRETPGIIDIVCPIPMRIDCRGVSCSAVFVLC